MAQRGDMALFTAAILVALACTAALSPENLARYAGFAAGLPAPAALALAWAMSLVALWWLGRTGRIGNGRAGLRVAALLGPAFFLPTMLVDLAQPWPPGINVPFPQSAPFYLAIVPLAEAVFHLAPLALATRLIRAMPLALFVAALGEPAFQVILGLEGELGFRDIYLALHLTLFGLAAFWLLGRHGLGAMMLLRVSYYACWHVGWGALRLEWLG